MSLEKVLINGKEVQVETVKVPITKLGDEVILDRFFSTIQIDRYWDSHGQKVYDKEHWPCETLKDKHIKIINHKQVAYDDINYDDWELQIDNIKWGSIEGYRILSGNHIEIDAPTGHG